jgi:2-oxo-hept-3-ene-1,7-dioate hydratase
MVLVRCAMELLMKPDDIAEAAKRLDEADITHKQIGLVSLQYPAMTIDDAYAIQAALIERQVKRGRVVKGWKIGLTSRAMQLNLNIDTPDSGVLFEDMFYTDGAIIPAGRYIQPRVEAEIAFVMKAPLKGGKITAADVRAATDYVVPALEIVDTRILRVDPETKKTRSLFDTIADNAANAGIVLGTQRHKLADRDLRWVGAIVKRDGAVEETGLGAGVLDDPALSVAWLVNRLALYGGGLTAGDVVLSGSFVRPLETKYGCLIEADFGSFGSVMCRFG